MAVSIVGNGSVATLRIQPYFGASLLQFSFVVRSETWSLEHSYQYTLLAVFVSASS